MKLPIYVYRVCYSQTDQFLVTVRATDRTVAEVKLNQNYTGANHFEFVGTIVSEVK